MRLLIVAGFCMVLALPAQSQPAESESKAPASASAQAAPVVSRVPPAVAYVEAFLDYRLQIQRRIEEAWAGYLKNYQGSLPRGRAVFTYHVNPDGKITLVEPKSGGHPTLVALAHRTIIEANAEMIAFPEIIRERHPSGYFNQIAFSLK